MTTPDPKIEALIARAREFVAAPNVHFHYKDGAEVMAGLADALSSLPAQAVGVKALEWFTELDHLAVAISPVGVWRVWNNLVLETPAPQTTKRYDNLDEAKAAAQADYEARIRSALSLPSRPAAAGERAVATFEVTDFPSGSRGLSELKPEQWWVRFPAGTHNLYASPPTIVPSVVTVTDAMVAAAEAAVYPRHERGFLSKPLIDAIDMRKALEAALVHRDQVKL